MDALQEQTTWGHPASEYADRDSRESLLNNEYRTVSRSAIAAAAFGLLAPLGAWAAVFLILPVLAVCFGAMALANIRRFPQELYGKKAAWFGVVLGLVCLIGGIGRHSYIYATEVPEGYQRMTFYDLRPNTRTSNDFFSARAAELDGQKVFIKGFVRPSDRRTKLKNFILVGDFGSCCFGGNPKMTDIVAVRILSDQTVDYSWSMRRITGTFRLNRTPRDVGEKDIPRICYEIEADHVW